MFHLNKIHIEGFKSEDRVIDYDFKSSNFTIVFGENGCGKTTMLNILHAIFAQDEAILINNKVRKIILSIDSDDGEHQIIIDEKKDESLEENSYHYDWNDYNNMKLSNIRTGFLAVERGSSSLAINIKASDLTRAFRNTSYGNQFWRENGNQAVTRLCEQISSFLSYSHNRRNRYVEDNIFNYEHIYLQGNKISINNLEEYIIERYDVIKYTAGQKIQSALFETFEKIIDSKNHDIEKMTEKNISFIKEEINSNYLIITKSLSSIKESNNILKIFTDKSEDQIIQECENNPQICLLLCNIIKAVNTEREYLNSVLLLQNEFNNITANNKNMKIDDKGIIIDVNGCEHSISELSSGEKQLLTQLTCLIIDSYNRDIFFIDEPEVSFNVMWQEKYIEMLKKCAPDTQFIIATHSPSIVSEHTEYLEELI